MFTGSRSTSARSAVLATGMACLIQCCLVQLSQHWQRLYWCISTAGTPHSGQLRCNAASQLTQRLTWQLDSSFESWLVTPNGVHC
ncbi:hypothetical protein COO60DRAFT_1523608 [Scenedesmus sp. NREL 46B-D3]|nr:hypothetical protein COO60DRAFT_1523608 [Scenedesmus sp. NREL 46B-D3]